MNRKERREFERQQEKMKKKPLYKMMKQIDDSLRGSGTDVKQMEGMLLAYQPNPEPIQIMFVQKNKGLFEDMSKHQLIPIFCYEQEANGSFSRVVANGVDMTKMGTSSFRHVSYCLSLRSPRE